jgi:hypothetical protein
VNTRRARKGSMDRKIKILFLHLFQFALFEIGLFQVLIFIFAYLEPFPMESVCTAGAIAVVNTSTAVFFLTSQFGNTCIRF